MHTVRITLELTVDGDALSGSATAGGPSRAFSGWLGLVAALDALVPGAVPEPLAPPTDHTEERP